MSRDLARVFRSEFVVVDDIEEEQEADGDNNDDDDFGASPIFVFAFDLALTKGESGGGASNRVGSFSDGFGRITWCSHVTSS